MDVLGHIKELLEEYEWSVYKLSKKSGIAQSTLANMFARNNSPSIPTLEMICKGFNIDMAEFFSADYMKNILTDDERKLLRLFKALNSEQKELIIKLMENIQK